MSIKVESLNDVVSNPDHPIMKEVHNSLDKKDGDIVTCKECGEEYTRGIWNFYNLCDPCFRIFDRKKMEDRFKMLFGNDQLK